MSDFSLSIRPKHDHIRITVDLSYALIVRWIGNGIALLWIAISLSGDTQP